jgi:hypothetical protein
MSGIGPKANAATGTQRAKLQIAGTEYRRLLRYLAYCMPTDGECPGVGPAIEKL